MTDYFAGYEHQVPIDSMQGLEISGQQGNQYGPMDNLPDLGPTSSDLNFENLESSLPQHADNNQAMPWFDTDLWTRHHSSFIHWKSLT